MYLEILEDVTIKHTEMKEKKKKEYLRRTEKILEAKLHSSNFMKGENTQVVPLIRYSGLLLNWTKEELQ